jgi:HK97 gp10 family phage protein
MADTVRIEGLSQLGNALRGLADVTARKLCVQATGAAARVVKDGVKEIIRTNPSVDTGSLLESVIVKKVSEPNLTSAHIVTPRHKRTKRQRKNRGKYPVAPHALFVQFGTVHMSAEPFLDVGLTRNRGKAEQAMKDKLATGIAREARRLGGK